MTRLARIIKLQELEQAKNSMCKQLSAMKSSYYKSGRMCFKNDTTDFYEKGPGENGWVRFNSKLMKQYLEMEIQQLEGHIRALLDELREESK